MEKNENWITHWTTANLKLLEISKMNFRHIIYTIKMLEGKGKQEPPDIWMGLRKEEWIDIFKTELRSRRKK